MLMMFVKVLLYYTIFKTTKLRLTTMHQHAFVCVFFYYNTGLNMFTFIVFTGKVNDQFII